MRKIILFIVGLVFSMGTCSQIGGRTTQTTAPRAGVREPFMTKQSVYFQDGTTLDEYTSYQWDAGYTHINNETRYSASGAMLEQVEFSYNEDRGYLSTRITRDMESRLRNRIVYQYNPQSQLSRESLVDNRGRVVSTYEYAYDGRGNRTNRVIRNRAGDKLAETTYTYDNQNRMVTSSTLDGSEVVISSTRYTYNAEGNLTSQQITNNEGVVTTNVRAVFQDGLEMRNEMTSAPDNRILMLITNEYGQDRELTRRVMDNRQGESRQVMRYEYIFRPRR